MRTDSTRVSEEALAAVRAYIGATFGAEAVPAEPRRFKQKKDAQDAHEAIRPTMLDLPPDAVASDLSADELKLYRLIWNRFVASQMTPSVSDVTTVEIEAARAGSPDVAGVRASGSVLKDPGWLRVYGQVSETEEAEGETNGNGDAEEGKVRLPQLAGGDALRLVEAAVEDHETQPPPRFNEASLVKFLEENGIGRPSTYAEILRKIEDREYVRKKDRRFLPTLLGRLVVDLMKEGFDDFFQTEYTARMEEELDEVEEGKLDWRKAVAEFDTRFRKDRDRALKKMVSVKAGLPLADVKTAPPRRPAPRGARGEVPEERRRAAPPDGEERPLRRLRRLPRLRLHRRHARARGGRDRRLRARGADVRRVRQPDEAPDGARRVVLPRLHGLPELPVHGRGEGGEREGRGAPRPPDRREVPPLRPRPRHEARPLRRLRRLLELPRLPLPAAEAGHVDDRRLPGVPDGRDPRPEGALRAVLRLLELPVVPRRTSARGPCRRPAPPAARPTSS